MRAVNDYMAEGARTDWTDCWFFGIRHAHQRGVALTHDDVGLSRSRAEVELAMGDHRYSLLALDDDRSVWLVGQSSFRGGWVEMGQRIGVLPEGEKEPGAEFAERLRAFTFMAIVAAEEWDRLDSQSPN